MLPVLAQHWVSEVWGVHSGAPGGGEAAGLCHEDCECRGFQGESTRDMRRLSVMVDGSSPAVWQWPSGEPVPHHQLGS